MQWSRCPLISCCCWSAAGTKYLGKTISASLTQNQSSSKSHTGTFQSHSFKNSRALLQSDSICDKSLNPTSAPVPVSCFRGLARCWERHTQGFHCHTCIWTVSSIIHHPAALHNMQTPRQTRGYVADQMPHTRKTVAHVCCSALNLSGAAQ